MLGPFLRRILLGPFFETKMGWALKAGIIYSMQSNLSLMLTALLSSMKLKRIKDDLLDIGVFT